MSLLLGAIGIGAAVLGIKVIKSSKKRSLTKAKPLTTTNYSNYNSISDEETEQEGIKMKDQGWGFLSNAGRSSSYYGADGSWGFTNDDGSGSYYGADGSWGFKNADGSGCYYGADGSWGFTNSDGSGSYYGADGSWGYKN